MLFGSNENKKSCFQNLLTFRHHKKKHPLYQHDQEVMTLCVSIDIGVKSVKSGVTKGSQYLKDDKFRQEIRSPKLNGDYRFFRSLSVAQCGTVWHSFVDVVQIMKFQFGYLIFRYLCIYYLASRLFVVVSWVIFLIPPEVVLGCNCMALLITFFLVLIKNFNTITNISPNTETMTAIASWMIASMFFVFGALLA